MVGTIAIPDAVPADLSSTCRRQVCTYTGPSAYPAGGDPLTPESVRMGKLFDFGGSVISNGSAVRIARWDSTNNKLQFFVPNTGAEAAGDLSAYSGTFEAIGQ